MFDDLKLFYVVLIDIGSLSTSRNREIFVYLCFGFLGWVVYVVSGESSLSSF